MFKNTKSNDLRPALSLKEQPWLLGGVCWGQQAITNKTKQNKQRFSVKAALRCELCVKTIKKMWNDFDRRLHMNSVDYGFGNISADPACIWELLLMFVRKPGPLKLVDALLFEGQKLCRISVSQLKLRQIICHMVARVSCHPSTTNGLTEASIPKFCRCGLDRNIWRIECSMWEACQTMIVNLRDLWEMTSGSYYAIVNQHFHRSLFDSRALWATYGKSPNTLFGSQPSRANIHNNSPIWYLFLIGYKTNDLGYTGR